MHCYDCNVDGRVTPAVAICTSCGAGICGDHTRMQSQDRSQTATPGNPSPLHTRSLLCVNCDGVLGVTFAHAIPGAESPLETPLSAE